MRTVLVWRPRGTDLPWQVSDGEATIAGAERRAEQLPWNEYALMDLPEVSTAFRWVPPSGGYVEEVKL